MERWIILRRCAFGSLCVATRCPSWGSRALLRFLALCHRTERSRTEPSGYTASHRQPLPAGSAIVGRRQCSRGGDCQNPTGTGAERTQNRKRGEGHRPPAQMVPQSQFQRRWPWGSVGVFWNVLGLPFPETIPRCRPSSSVVIKDPTLQPYSYIECKNYIYYTFEWKNLQKSISEVAVCISPSLAPSVVVSAVVPPAIASNFVFFFFWHCFVTPVGSSLQLFWFILLLLFSWLNFQFVFQNFSCGKKCPSWVQWGVGTDWFVRSPVVYFCSMKNNYPALDYLPVLQKIYLREP